MKTDQVSFYYESEAGASFKVESDGDDSKLSTEGIWEGERQAHHSIMFETSELDSVICALQKLQKLLED